MNGVGNTALDLDRLGAIGYGLTAALFLLLGMVLLTGWRGRLQGGLLVTAVLASALWAGMSAIQSAWHWFPVSWLWTIEALRDAAWALFLIKLLELQAGVSAGRIRILAIARFAVLAVTVLLTMPVGSLLAGIAPNTSFNFASVRLGIEVLAAVGGLVLVEQVFRNTPWQHRWGIKHLCLGVGGLFAFDFFLFADALLFQQLDLDIWLARGAVGALTVPLIGVSAARNPQWSFDLFVSRKVVFHSTALFAAGIYLLFMSLAGYYIRYYGGEWSSVMQIVFFFGAVIVLIVLFFSGRLRSRIKLLATKHFFNYRYDYREEWLHLIDILSGKVLAATLADRIIFALAELVESPGGLLWLCPPGRRCEPARAWNLPEDILDKSTDMTALARFLGERPQTIDLNELRRDPESCNGLQLPAALLANERLWLIVPLRHDDVLLGMVFLARPRSPQAVDWEVADILVAAARQAASYLALDQAARSLAEARQFEGFNRLSAFVVHDLKNLIAQLSLVAKNAERHRHNPAFIDDAMSTIRSSVEKMNRLLIQLRNPVGRESGMHAELVELVGEVVKSRSVQEPVPLFDNQACETLPIRADADRLGSVIAHIVQNAQEATPPDGRVVVRLARIDSEAVVEVQDSGCGMDSDFIRERLFKPFDSTKGLTGMGIGAYETRELVQSLGGRVAVESASGRGTLFRIILPIMTEALPNLDLAVG